MGRGHALPVRTPPVLPRDFRTSPRGGNRPSVRRKCTRLEVTGDVLFAPGVVLEGDVVIVNEGPFQRILEEGRSYSGEVRSPRSRG